LYELFLNEEEYKGTILMADQRKIFCKWKKLWRLVGY